MMIPACSLTNISELVSQFHSILAPGPPKLFMWRWPACKATLDRSWPMPISSICVDGFLNPSRFIFNISVCPSIPICSLFYLTKTKSMIIGNYYCTCSDSVFSILSHLTVADTVFAFFLACPNLIKYVLVSIYTRGPLPHWVAYVIPSFATDRSMFLMWVCEFFLSWRSWLALRNLSLVYLLSSNLFCPSSIALHLLLTHFLLSYLNVSSSGKSCVMVSYLSGLVYLTPKMMAPLGIAQKAPRTPANYSPGLHSFKTTFHIHRWEGAYDLPPSMDYTIEN